MLTTHELTEAEKLADRIVILSAGRMVREGTPAALTGASQAAGLSFGAPPGLDDAPPWRPHSAAAAPGL